MQRLLRDCFSSVTAREPRSGGSHNALLRLSATIGLLAFGAAPVMAEPNDGVVTGTVISKTAGSGSIAGATVTLVSFGRKEQAPVGQKTTQTDADGHYSFDGLDRDSNLLYIPLVRYQNVNYPGDQPFQLNNKPNQQADITVYDTTTDDGAIQLERLNLLVMGADQGTLQMMEMGSIVNKGDRTFVTANPQDQALARAIKFALPTGALNVQMQTGFNQQDLTASVGGVQVVSPLPPGQHEFALSFQLPYQSSSADISMQMPYPTSAYSVYLPSGGSTSLEGTPLASGGTAQLGGQSYALYIASNIPKSSVVSGRVSGLGGPGLSPANQLALISLGVLLFVIGGGVLLFGGRLRPAGVAPQRSAAELEEERLELVVKLAALDERFAAGELKRAEYEAERSRGKQRLRELTVASRHTVTSGV